MPRTQWQDPFHKGVLIPFWILRLLSCGISAVLYAFVLAVAIRWLSGGYDSTSYANNPYSDLDDAAFRTIAIVSGVFMAVMIFLIILDLAMIVKYARHTLKPKTFLVVNVIQTLIVVVILVLAITGMVRTGSGTASISVIVTTILYFGLLIYASVIYHRSRKAGSHQYLPTSNPANYTSEPAPSYAQQTYGWQPPSQVPAPHGQAGEYYGMGNVRSAPEPVNPFSDPVGRDYKTAPAVAHSDVSHTHSVYSNTSGATELPAQAHQQTAHF